MLSPKAKAALPAYHHPERHWKKKWSGVWYLLAYDVPEADRRYRHVLRTFLKKMRMGCLQKSTWVSARDIRPEFADLMEAASVGSFAHLFEARSVLGRDTRDIVTNAWDFDRIGKLQSRYCKVYEKNLQALQSQAPDAEHLLNLARQEMQAYRWSMERDPLLPASLWPEYYKGPRVWELHKALTREIAQRLRRV